MFEGNCRCTCSYTAAPMEIDQIALASDDPHHQELWFLMII
jgi:hypothetical protein